MSRAQHGVAATKKSYREDAQRGVAATKKFYREDAKVAKLREEIQF